MDGERYMIITVVTLSWTKYEKPTTSEKKEVQVNVPDHLYV